MKKYTALLAVLLLSGLTAAETVKLKNGTFVSGSIVSQTEYTLNLQTSYGPVVLNQREVEAVLPDKHRVILQGGGQLIGIITDLDEFNMTLQTDSGIVHIDMPQIVTVEVYDYEQGDAAQQTIARKQAEQQAREEAALAAMAAQAALAGVEEQTAKNLAAYAPTVPANIPNRAPQTAAPAAPVQAAGGLNFDADIEKVFDSKTATVVDGRAQTVQEISAAEIRAQRAAQQAQEDAFLRGERPAEAAAIAKTAEAARSGKLEKMQKSQNKKESRIKDSTTNKYFAISVGAQNTSMTLDNSRMPGYENTSPYDIGGTGIRAETTFMWRIGSSNFWVGPSIALSTLPKTSFEDLDPTIDIQNNEALAAGREEPYPAGSDRSVQTSGQMIDAAVKANYYFNPDNLLSCYITATAGYRMLSLDYRGVIEAHHLSSNGFVGGAGAGIEMHVDDLMLGLEVQELFSPYGSQFKESSSASTVATLKFSWKF